MIKKIKNIFLYPLHLYGQNQYFGGGVFSKNFKIPSHLFGQTQAFCQGIFEKFFIFCAIKNEFSVFVWYSNKYIPLLIWSGRAWNSTHVLKKFSQKWIKKNNTCLTASVELKGLCSFALSVKHIILWLPEKRHIVICRTKNKL